VTPRQTRALRGVAAAWVATIIAATAHTLAADGAPAPLLVAAIAVLASPIGVALAGRRLSAWRIGAIVLASQALFHVAFAITAGTGTEMAGHDHRAAAAYDTAPAAVSALLPAAPMLLAHLLAAALSVIALHRGERMLRALGRGIRRLIRLGVDLVPPLHADSAQPRPANPRPVVRPVLLSDVTRRGPPALLAAAG